MSNNKNDILKKFLDTRALIDTQPKTDNTPKKDVRNVVEKSYMADTSSYKHIINTKPKAKVVIEFLRDKVASLIDDDSDSD
jgi:hypothetical protein